jgi:hypothetical protein
MTTKLSLQLDDYTSDESLLFTEEVGTLVFQSALMKYLASEKEEVTREFETFINLQIGSEKFIENLCQKYPSFGEILNNEMLAFQSEMESLTK